MTTLKRLTCLTGNGVEDAGKAVGHEVKSIVHDIEDIF